jgi:hypothetical protein
MTAGYRDFRPRDEDPSDHAAVAAMQARDEARRIAANIAKLPELFRSPLRVLALAQRTPQRYRYVVARTIRFELWQLIV